MKKTISIFLSLCLAFTLGVSVFADESDSITFYNPRIDILEFPTAADEYKTDKEILQRYTDKPDGAYSPDYTSQMDTIVEDGYILLPGFVDIENIKTGELEIHIEPSVSGSIYTITGVTDNTSIVFERIRKYNGGNYVRGDQAVSKIVGDIEINGSYEVRQNLSSATVFDYVDGKFAITDIITEVPYPYLDETYYEQRFSFTDYSFYYTLNVKTNTPFDDIWEIIAPKPYPLKNGFIDIGDNRYYGYNGTLLKGWYKIGGNYYYFDKDNIAVKGEYQIGDILYTFDENGVYRQQKRI
ncbi:MAG: hypothetical protein LBM41_02710 [Ruminococcus sp.]|jgi:hypothetical protein|nr:hypothetical protein [Ruminococcus sp.]